MHCVRARIGLMSVWSLLHCSALSQTMVSELFVLSEATTLQGLSFERVSVVDKRLNFLVMEREFEVATLH
jgi:hypothetical protein